MQWEMKVTIDEAPFSCRVEGDFAWGEGGALFDWKNDLLTPALGRRGWTIIDLPSGFAPVAARAVGGFLAQHDIPPPLEHYHRRVDDARHHAVISRSRNLRFAELDIDGEEFCRMAGELLKVRLATEIKSLGDDHVQVRINRPGSTDFNPPHRDAMPGYEVFNNAVNFWIPIAGCNSGSSLPLLPGSHLIAPSECWQTRPGNAAIGGRTYQVPAIIKTRGGDLSLIRPPVGPNQALVFTPYLVHGGAVNQNPDITRIALELRLTVVGQNYPQSRGGGCAG